MKQLELVKVEPNYSITYSFDERRCQPRINCNLRARLHSLSSLNDYEFEVKDLSLLGVRLMAGTYLDLPPISLMSLDIPDFQQTRYFSCQVVWTCHDYENKTVVGVAFRELDDHQRSLIRYLCVLLLEIEKTKRLSFHPHNLIGSREKSRKIYDELTALKLDAIVEKYANISNKISKRSVLLWKWCRYLNEKLTLPCVAPEYVDYLCNIKTIDMIFMTLFDDIVDERKDLVMFKEAKKIICEFSDAKFSFVNEEQRYYLEVCRDMWVYICKQMYQLPRNEEFLEFFFYDYKQLMNSFDYSLMVNSRNYAINDREYDSYLGHSMHVLVNAMQDVMCSPSFNLNELGLLRSLVIDVQSMCRICNWLTTWERELLDLDLTSGVVAVALQEKVIDHKDLKEVNNVPLLIEKIKDSNVCEKLLLQWEEKRVNVESAKNRIKSLDLNCYLEAVNEFLTYSFAFKGVY